MCFNFSDSLIIMPFITVSILAAIYGSHLFFRGKQVNCFETEEKKNYV